MAEVILDGQENVESDPSAGKTSKPKKARQCQK
jgi:hypothetical protein